MGTHPHLREYTLFLFSRVVVRNSRMRISIVKVKDYILLGLELLLLSLGLGKGFGVGLGLGLVTLGLVLGFGIGLGVGLDIYKRSGYIAVTRHFRNLDR